MAGRPGNHKFLIDGFPRAMDQCIAFEEQCGPAECCLFFDCPEEELEKRYEILLIFFFFFLN
jgi:UMP-CMP kinase